MADFDNLSYSDREFLDNLFAINGKEGATTAEIAERLVKSNGKVSPLSKVAPRLAWMRRFGFIDRVDQEGNTIPPGTAGEGVWLLTEAGMLLRAGRLSKAVETAFSKMDPGSQLLAMRTLTQRAYVQGSQETATAIRREYLHQAAKR